MTLLWTDIQIPIMHYDLFLSYSLSIQHAKLLEKVATGLATRVKMSRRSTIYFKAIAPDTTNAMQYNKVILDQKSVVATRERMVNSKSIY